LRAVARADDQSEEVNLIILRRKLHAAPRPYRTLGYPLVPLVYILLALLLVLDLAYLTPETSGIGYLLVLTGIPIYFLWRNSAPANRVANSDAGTQPPPDRGER
jgi:basic amino acid/polyamine antiporter, APA family